MTKDNCVNDHNGLKKDLESLNLKIKDVLGGGSLSAEGLKSLIKEAEEAQKRLIQNTEGDKENKENT